MFIDQLIEGCELRLTACFGAKTAEFTSKVAGIYYPNDRNEISDFLEKNQIKQRAPESIFPPEPAANVERFVNRPPLVCVQSPAPAYFCRQVKAVDP